MHEPRDKTRSAIDRLAVVVLLAMTTLAVAGCAQTRDWLGSRSSTTAERETASGTTNVGADGYLQELYRLATGDPFTQVEIHADAESAATLTPDTSTRLRYALVLATPGHAAADAQQAQNLLRELLSQTELMTPTEVALATLFLNDVEERIVLGAETRRLRSENAEAQSTEQQAIAQRVQNVEAENRRLRAELEDARQKLEAITSIERSIRAQENDGN